MGYALEISELGLCCVNPMTGKCWTKMTKSEECGKQGVKYSMAYCGSGYNKRRKYAVHAEWEWKHFQEFLSGSKLKSEKNDLFRHLMIPQHVEDLQAQLGTENVHITTLNWLMRAHEKKNGQKPKSTSSGTLRKVDKLYEYEGGPTPREKMPKIVRKSPSMSKPAIGPHPKHSPQWRACMAQVLKDMQKNKSIRSLKPEDCSSMGKSSS